MSAGKHTHVHPPESNALSIEEMIRNAGGKLTPQRSEILKVLKSHDKPVTAKDIFESVKQTHPSVSLDTVYRNLEMLTSAGIVCQMNLTQSGKSFYEFMGDKHHHHAICTTCGEIQCVEACLPLADVVVEGDKDFQITGHAFEIYGLCGKCKP